MIWRAKVLVKDGAVEYFEDWTDCFPPDRYKRSYDRDFEQGEPAGFPDEGTWYAVEYDDGEPS